MKRSHSSVQLLGSWSIAGLLALFACTSNPSDSPRSGDRPSASYGAADERSMTLSIPKMDDTADASSVTKALEALPGVIEVKPNVLNATVRLKSNGHLSIVKINQALMPKGFSATQQH